MAGLDASAKAGAIALREPWVCNCLSPFRADFELENGPEKAFVEQDRYLIHGDGLCEYLQTLRTAMAALLGYTIEL